MSFRFLHTSDWHLGQSFHGQSRHVEHAAFLDWLLSQLAQHAPDALLIAGDLFDVVNPSLAAQELLYDFIVRAHEQDAALEIVMIAGNHDSGSRIELPAALLARLKTHALGRVRWVDESSHGGEAHTLDSQHLLVPLHDRDGTRRALCLAVPFLRPAEVTGLSAARHDEDESKAERTRSESYRDGVAHVHEALVRAARAERQPGEALIAMGHAHMRDGEVSENSERPILMGGEEALPTSLFPTDIAYVALGHLHRPQRVGGEERIRYCGTPLAMDFSEVDYGHRVLEVVLEGEQLEKVYEHRVPCHVELLRLGPAPLAAITAQLTQTAANADKHLEQARWPWLEVTVELESPVIDLRARIEELLEEAPLRLIKLATRYPRPSAEHRQPDNVKLDELGPLGLLDRHYRAIYDSPPDATLIEDFAQLLEEVEAAREARLEGEPMKGTSLANDTLPSGDKA
ncbi:MULTISPECIES: exonuclease SbcCD subunit D C-terminal domain-containing protein [Cobetia]|uniref:Nuclease SbcCD subunit D n=1 Tax=Cobetia crustatorum TaxID=553385 RepID=A0A558HU99_9GAMM|nr:MULTISPECIES: exonuclease SbcCD subunit D C-terminal domain-containing protein [Cobetia]TVU72685.1 exonuclease subunit SbcD [Cobetia crustatorum]